eukprot:360817-Chlamydomonas_euryale.AAC.9
MAPCIAPCRRQLAAARCMTSAWRDNLFHCAPPIARLLKRCTRTVAMVLAPRANHAHIIVPESLLVVARMPLDGDDVFLFHRTTGRVLHRGWNAGDALKP